MIMNFIVIFFIVPLAFSALASSHDSTTSLRNRRHVRRSLNHSSTTNITVRGEKNILQRRFGPNARFSWYHPGLGACGKTNGPNDFIVALTHEQFGNGEHCFEPITITYKGKITQATIVDECMECPYAALDFSPGLFNFFGSTADGYLYGSWEFGSSGSGQESKPKTTTSAPPPKPTTTKKVVPLTTGTWTPEPTTSEKALTSTSTTSTRAAATSTSVVSKQASSSVASSSSSTDIVSMSANPSTTAVTVPTDNFGRLELVMADLGAILVGGVLVGADKQ